MLRETIKGYLETGSGRLSHRAVSAGILACLNIVPYNGVPIHKEIDLNEAKFSLIILYNRVPIVQIDNDHPIEISGGQFHGLHRHEFGPFGETISRVPVFGIVNIGEAGSLAEKLWKQNT